MKRLFTLISVLFTCIFAYSQDYSDTVPLKLTDQPPMFNGGDIKEFAKWVNMNLVYPEDAKSQNITGKVMVQFIVDTEGMVKNPRVLSSAHPSLGAEVIRIVSSSPKWEPGLVNGKPVSVALTHTVGFQLATQSPAEPVLTESTPNNSQEESIPFQLVEGRPSFNGGDANEFSKWVNSRLVYPEKAKEKGIEGRVTLQFVIDIDGSVKDVKVLKSDHKLLEKEAVRVVSSSPKWKPGMQEGKPVRVTYTFPVVFGLGWPKK